MVSTSPLRGAALYFHLRSNVWRLSLLWARRRVATTLVVIKPGVCRVLIPVQRLVAAKAFSPGLSSRLRSAPRLVVSPSARSQNSVEYLFATRGLQACIVHRARFNLPKPVSSHVVRRHVVWLRDGLWSVVNDVNFWSSSTPSRAATEGDHPARHRLGGCNNNRIRSMCARLRGPSRTAFWVVRLLARHADDPVSDCWWADAECRFTVFLRDPHNSFSADPKIRWRRQTDRYPLVWRTACQRWKFGVRADGQVAPR